jgi:hypothetical protein
MRRSGLGEQLENDPDVSLRFDAYTAASRDRGAEFLKGCDVVDSICRVRLPAQRVWLERHWPGFHISASRAIHSAVLCWVSETATLTNPASES